MVDEKGIFVVGNLCGLAIEKDGDGLLFIIWNGDGWRDPEELAYYLEREEVLEMLKNIIKHYLNRKEKDELLDFIMKELGLREVSFKRL
jgi:hypothetical protein